MRTVPPEDLDQTWLNHWRAVVEGSGVHKLGGVMCSYAALDGVPMCGNRKMLNDKLRTEWGFSGWVVSDCGAVTNIATSHHYVNSERFFSLHFHSISLYFYSILLQLYCMFTQSPFRLAGTMEVGALALTAGCDIECDSTFSTLPEAISAGLALESDVDTALFRSLIQQFAMGVFDKPELNPYTAIGLGEHTGIPTPRCHDDLIVGTA